MAEDQDRAERIRALRRDKHLRWKQIAEHVGVELRSAQMWQETGSISYENAKKLAELAGVDVDYIMRGTDNGTPSPFAGPDAVNLKLDQILDNQAAIITRLDALEAALTGAIETSAEHEAQQVAAEIVERWKAGDLPARPPAREPRAPRTAPKKTRTA